MNMDLILFKNHYLLLKKLHVFINKQDRKYVCRKYFNSYHPQSGLTTQKTFCGNNDKPVYIPIK